MGRGGHVWTEVETGRNRPQPSIGGVSGSGKRREGPSAAVLCLATVAPGHSLVSMLSGRPQALPVQALDAGLSTG